MRVLLTGASGFVGRKVRQVLEGRGHEVVGASRATGIDFRAMLAEADWRAHLEGIEAVVNSVGIIVESADQRFDTLHHLAPSALFRACVSAGIRRVVQISALGASAGAPTGYLRSKHAADEILRGLPLEGWVLRPSLVYGPEGRSTALFRRLASLPLIPLVGQGDQRIQPVHLDDLAAAVAVCLETASESRTVDLVGPQAMTFAHWLQRLRVQTGRQEALTLPLPLSWLLALSRIGRHLVPLFHPDNLHMLQQGSTADPAPLAALLGRMPRHVP